MKKSCVLTNLKLMLSSDFETIAHWFIVLWWTAIVKPPVGLPRSCSVASTDLHMKLGISNVLTDIVSASSIISKSMNS